MVVSKPVNNNTEPPFRIENKVMKGQVISFDSQYTSVGELLFDSLKNNPDIIGQLEIDISDKTSRRSKNFVGLIQSTWLVVGHKDTKGTKTLPSFFGYFLRSLVMAEALNTAEYREELRQAKLNDVKFRTTCDLGVRLESDNVLKI